MKPENCPFRSTAYEHRDIGSAKAVQLIRCMAAKTKTPGKGAIIGMTEAEALQNCCSKCPVPPALDKAPKDAVPEPMFTMGRAAPVEVLWRCSTCKSIQLKGYDTLTNCH